MTAVCARCRNVAGWRSEPWWRWRCLDMPLPRTYNPVTGKDDLEPPHVYCKNRNRDGKCDAFSPLPADAPGPGSEFKYSERTE